jgi:hypothetical protein
MALENKSLSELTELKVKLLKQINVNPAHSGIERVELEDVQQWIELRVREQERAKLTSEPAFEEIDK